MHALKVYPVVLLFPGSSSIHCPPVPSYPWLWSGSTQTPLGHEDRQRLLRAGLERSPSLQTHLLNGRAWNLGYCFSGGERWVPKA